MKQLFNFLLYVFIIIMIIDGVGFVMWSLSGQIPANEFYIGSITKNLIHELYSEIK